MVQLLPTTIGQPFLEKKKSCDKHLADEELASDMVGRNQSRAKMSINIGLHSSDDQKHSK